VTVRPCRALSILALAALPAFALEAPTSPPPEGVAARMKALQSVLADRESSATQRESAREELASLLRSLAGQARARSNDEKPARPARAAIEPVPTTVIPSPSNPVPMPGIAKLEVIEPPRPTVNPLSGSTSLPAPSGFAVDPRTGNVLHPVPGGAIDPRTGQFVPR
jgi:hypothetical protein